MMFIVQTLLANVTHDPHLHSYVYVDSPLIVSIKFYSLIYANIKFYVLIYPTLSLLCKILYCEHTHWPLISLSLSLSFSPTVPSFLASICSPLKISTWFIKEMRFWFLRRHPRHLWSQDWDQRRSFHRTLPSRRWRQHHSSSRCQALLM